MTDPTVDVSVVVVSFNSAADLPECLRSIRPAAGPSVSTEVLLVDNASEDDSVEVARATGTADEIVELPANVGFGRAVNHGARRGRGRHVLLVNPDAILRPGAIAALVAFADRHPAHGFYGGRTVDRNGVVDPRSCWALPSLWSMVCFATGLASWRRGSPVFDPATMGGWQRDTLREVGAISGCFLLARREAWTLLGGFDEDYFMYGEDIDLGARAHRAGFRPVVVPDSEIVHTVGGSSRHLSARTVLVLSGRATYLRKQWTPVRRRVGLALLRAGVAGRAAAEAAASAVGGRSGRRWRSVWSERSRWVCGYPPQSGVPSSGPGRPALPGYLTLK